MILEIKISISEDVLKVCPEFSMAAIECKVKNSNYNKGLWEEIDNFTSYFIQNYKMEDIKKRPAIEATRKVYKKL